VSQKRFFTLRTNFDLTTGQAPWRTVHVQCLLKMKDKWNQLPYIIGTKQKQTFFPYCKLQMHCANSFAIPGRLLAPEKRDITKLTIRISIRRSIIYIGNNKQRYLSIWWLILQNDIRQLFWYSSTLSLQYFFTTFNELLFWIVWKFLHQHI